MKGFKTEIESKTLENADFRRVLYTADYSQLVLMNLRPGEEIGLETHAANDQFFRVEKGYGKCFIDGNEYELRDGDAVVVPSGSEHNIINVSHEEELKLYTIYSPPHHLDGIVRASKAEAEDPENQEEFNGATSEKGLTFDGDDEDDDEVSTKISEKISAVKSKRLKRKLLKNAKKIAKFESKIEALKGKMEKLHHAE